MGGEAFTVKEAHCGSISTLSVSGDAWLLMALQWQPATGKQKRDRHLPCLTAINTPGSGASLCWANI